MNLEVWIAFTLASTLMLVIPGPTIIMIMSQAMVHGRRSVMPLIAGIFIADIIVMALSFLGFGVLLSASATLFSVFKWIGALYLIYLGIKLWISNPENNTIQLSTENASSRSLLRSTLIVTVFNPKGIIFFAAFFPQFIDPLKPANSQLILLAGTFLLLATITAAFCALFASQLSERMKKGRIHKWFNRGGGTALIGAGIFTAGVRSS